MADYSPAAGRFSAVMFASALLCYAYALRPLLRVARPYPRASSAFFAPPSLPFCISLVLALSPASSLAFRPHLVSRSLFRLVLVLIAPYLCVPLRPLLQTADRSEGKKLSIGDSLKQLIRRIIRELSPERSFNPNNAPFAVEIQPHTLEARLFFLARPELLSPIETFSSRAPAVLCRCRA